jgi:choline-phosphate cytidylyltransferase
MVKVITYGTFDLLHKGHIRLLERAKILGDYLIVGVTSDDFDKARGKLNVQQNLMERIEAVRATGIADEIVVEEYEGQKIEDIQKYGVDIFTVGSDWCGKFDYLKDYCQVIYLPRTEGISSSALRTEKYQLQLGLVGESIILEKFLNECKYVNSVKLTAVCSAYPAELPECLQELPCVTSDYDVFLNHVEAVYIMSTPKLHYTQVKKALLSGKHVLCETPEALTRLQCEELHCIAKKNALILAEGNKTAYATAYIRLILMLKAGKIGDVISVDATSTSLSEKYFVKNIDDFNRWNSIEAWGAKSLLPVFHILGSDYSSKQIISHITSDESMFDSFTIINFVYPHAVATVKVGKGIKSENELIIVGTKGYIYVPAPWWKTDYFEIRYENRNENKRYFYQLDGEGIRYEVIAFVNAIKNKNKMALTDESISRAIAEVMEDYYSGKDMVRI